MNALGWLGTGNDTLTGNNGADKCYGDSGDDHLMRGLKRGQPVGWAGKDPTKRERGADHLFSGGGGKTQIFEMPALWCCKALQPGMTVRAGGCNNDTVNVVKEKIRCRANNGQTWSMRGVR